jgi:amino acid transporter
MKKNEFKKMMKKENKAFKNYYVYEMILILLLAIIVIPNIILTINNMIPFNITIINILLIIIIALLIAAFDIKNDLDIKNMYQYYLKEKKIPEYKDKTKILNVCLIISITILIIWAIITIPNITKTENLSEIENTLVITTNKGNNIETQYEMFDGFKIKIPSEFKIMSDEIVNVKYTNGNAPSLVYTNDKTTINVALVMNDVTMKNSQIEEYVKTME